MAEVAPGPDRYSAGVTPGGEGRWWFQVEAWGDPIAHWRHDAAIKVPRGLDVGLMMAEGAILFERAARSPSGRSRTARPSPPWARPTDQGIAHWDWLAAADAAEITAILDEAPLRESSTRSAAYPLVVHRQRALYGAWVPAPPRSEGVQIDPMGPGRQAGGRHRRHGVRRGLPAAHPPHRDHRPQGARQRAARGARRPGLAVGDRVPGRRARRDPSELGTFADFDAFVARVRELGMEVALDLALQTSPDHPWVTEHPDWFSHRACGAGPGRGTHRSRPGTAPAR